jgi:hypothetical protein
MPHSNDEPSAAPVMLTALSGIVALMIGFAALLYWAAQPTVLQNAPISGFQAEMRRATAMANAILTSENRRAAKPADSPLDRQGLSQLARQAASEVMVR